MLAESSFARRGAAPSRHRKSLQHELQGSAHPLLYRQFFTPEECKTLDRCPPDSAVSEIYLLRALIARVLASARKVRLTLKHRFSMLTAFCQAALTMASLARFEHKARPAADPILAALAGMDPDDL
jgi:hypothetical protein